MGDGDNSTLVPRLCYIVRWPDFNGFGFNLHAEKGKAGQFIGKVDDGSPAEAAGLKAGDRIVEVNGTNIGNENHQQVVGRIKAGGDEARLLVVDSATDQQYKDEKKVVRGDLPEVQFITSARDTQYDTPDPEPPAPVDMEPASSDTNGAQDPEPTIVTEPEPEALPDESARYPARLCQLCKWPDFDGYGFNLQAEKDKSGQYIGNIDNDSPAQTGGLKEGDRIIEVNGENIETLTHREVIMKVKAGGDRTALLVVDDEADEYYRSRGQAISSSMDNVLVITTPPREAGVEDTFALSHAEPQDPAVYDWGNSPVEVSRLDTGQAAQEDGETQETVTAAVIDQVESAPEPIEVQNGAEEEAAVAVAAVTMNDDVAVIREDDEDTGAYEEVELPSSVPPSYEEQFDKKHEEGSGQADTEDKVAAKAEEKPLVEEAAVSANSGADELGAEAPVQADPGKTGIEEETVEAGNPGKTPRSLSEGAPAGNQSGAGDAATVSEDVAEDKREVTSEESKASPEAATNGLNGGATVESTQAAVEPEPAVIGKVEPEPAPAPAVITSVSSTPAASGDLNLNLSAAEMKERLRSRKKQDPRLQKTSFEAKHKMFEKM